MTRTRRVDGQVATVRIWPEFPGSLAAHGYEYQRVLVLPDRELVVAFLGKTPDEGAPLLREHLRAVLRSASNGA